MDIFSISRAISSIRALMESNRDYLGELDAQSGDGDLGISMCSGFRAIDAYASSVLASMPSDLGVFFKEMSRVFNDSAPSTLGTIISIGMMGIAQS